MGRLEGVLSVLESVIRRSTIDGCLVTADTRLETGAEVPKVDFRLAFTVSGTNSSRGGSYLVVGRRIIFSWMISSARLGAGKEPEVLETLETGSVNCSGWVVCLLVEGFGDVESVFCRISVSSSSSMLGLPTFTVARRLGILGLSSLEGDDGGAGGS